jgi:hypothetical protein
VGALAGGEGTNFERAHQDAQKTTTMVGRVTRRSSRVDAHAARHAREGPRFAREGEALDVIAALRATNAC